MEIGRLQITRRDEEGKALLYQDNEDVLGQWLDSSFVTRWETTRMPLQDDPPKNTLPQIAGQGRRDRQQRSARNAR